MGREILTFGDTETENLFSTAIRLLFFKKM